ncbi:hypothetical protein Ancab_035824, partial [Ancistrocladus abbreviatus]
SFDLLQAGDDFKESFVWQLGSKKDGKHCSKTQGIAHLHRRKTLKHNQQLLSRVVHIVKWASKVRQLEFTSSMLFLGHKNNSKL